MAARLSAGTVKVAGLRELSRELRKLDDAGLIGELKDANYAVASLVVDAARDRASSKMERRAADSLKASRQAARAQVTGGGARVPFFGGAEFGGFSEQPRQRVTGTYTGFRQFKPWRGSGTGAGYFLYPAIRDETDRIVEMYGDALDEITRRAFPD